MELKWPEITEPIIGDAIAVHRELGPGQPEQAYQEALAAALGDRGVSCKTEMPLPVSYCGLHIDCGYRLDLLVEDLVVLELKCVEALLPIHTAQLLTYLRLSKRRLGLLLNFNVSLLKDGIRRVLDDDWQQVESAPTQPFVFPGMRDELMERVIAAGQRVHAALGPGLLASAYESCLLHELSLRNLGFSRKVKIPLAFRGRILGTKSILDTLVEHRLPLRIYSLNELTPLHFASFSAQLRHGNWPTGLLFNFNVTQFEHGFHVCGGLRP